MNASAFTLLELLIVLVVIALAAAFVLPNSFRNIEHLKLKTTARDVAAVLRYARSRAVSENRIYKVIYLSDEHCFSVSAAVRKKNSDPWHRISAAPVMEMVQQLVIDDRIAVTANQEEGREQFPGVWEFVFFPEGSSMGGAMSLRNHKDQRYFVCVDNISGEVRVGEEVDGNAI